MQDQDGISDEELAERVRSGDENAFGVLWQRHSAAGRATARQFSDIADADDLVSDAYLSILRALRGGGGPRQAFRAYLYRTIRNIAYTRARTERPVSLELVGEIEDDAAEHETATIENDLTARAFRALPERWQTVLWYTEVEGMEPAEAATFLGMSANGVSALAYRAREGLRRAWLQAHVGGGSVPEGCRWTTERMGDYVRGSLSARGQQRFDRHLVGCARCALLLEELGGLSRRLASVLLPATLGGGAAAALLAARDAAPASGSGREPGSAGTTGLSTVAVASGVIGIAVLVAAGYGIAEGLTRQPSHEEPVAITQPTTPPAPTTVPTAEPTPTPEPDPTPTPQAPGAVPRPPSPGVTAVVDTFASPPTAIAPAGPQLLLPVISGAAEPNARVDLRSSTGQALGSGTARADGGYAIPLDDPRAASVDVVAVQTDLAGNVSAPSATVTVDFERPQILLPSPDASLASTGGATAVEVRIGGIEGTQVRVLVDEVATGNLHTLEADPIVRYTAPLTDGLHTVAVQYRDPSTGGLGSSVAVTFRIG